MQLCRFSGKSQFKFTLALYGPGGIGKRSLIRTVANACGLPVKIVHCAQLIEESEIKIIQHFDDVVIKKQKPSIFVLHRLEDLLYPSSTNSASGLDYIQGLLIDN